MKTHRAILFLMIIYMAYHPGMAQDSPTDQEVEEKTVSLLRSIENFNLYFEKADAEKLNEMLTERYMHTNGSSKPYTKEIWLNYIRSRKTKLEASELVMNDYGMKDISISFYDQVALVNGVVYSKGMEKDEPFDKKFRVTHLWVLESGQWKRAGFHDGIID